VPKKMDVEVVAFIVSQILAEYKPVMSVLWVKPIKERMLELVKKVYLEYWGTKFKCMEQPKESDGNVALYTEGGKKPRNYKKFKGNRSYCGIQGHKQANCHKKKAVEKSGEETPKPEKSGEEKPKLGGAMKKCFWCKEKGHIARDYPTKKQNQGDVFFVRMALFSDESDIEPWTLSE